MTQNNRYKVAVIGGGTGLPVILKGLKNLNADITAIVTVADDGGSSGTIRNYVNVVPPGDIRNCMIALSEINQDLVDMFQYRFDSEDDFLAGHALGNLIIAALKEMKGSLHEAIELLSKWMKIQGQILPAAPEALVLNALFEDGSIGIGESTIANHRKKIKEVMVTNSEGEVAIEASAKVVDAIYDADMVVIGPGSLYTSILPNLMIGEIGEAICKTSAQIVYICNIMTQLGETENFTDANHVEVLHEHLKMPFVDTVLVNIAPVPEDYIKNQPNEEYLLQVMHDFNGIRQQGCHVISSELLNMQDGGAYHDTVKVVKELGRILDRVKLLEKNEKRHLMIK